MYYLNLIFKYKGGSKIDEFNAWVLKKRFNMPYYKNDRYYFMRYLFNLEHKMDGIAFNDGIPDEVWEKYGETFVNTANVLIRDVSNTSLQSNALRWYNYHMPVDARTEELSVPYPAAVVNTENTVTNELTTDTPTVVSYGPRTRQNSPVTSGKGTDTPTVVSHGPRGYSSKNQQEGLESFNNAISAITSGTVPWDMFVHNYTDLAVPKSSVGQYPSGSTTAIVDPLGRTYARKNTFISAENKYGSLPSIVVYKALVKGDDGKSYSYDYFIGVPYYLNGKWNMKYMNFRPNDPYINKLRSLYPSLFKSTTSRSPNTTDMINLTKTLINDADSLFLSPTYEDQREIRNKYVRYSSPYQLKVHNIRFTGDTVPVTRVIDVGTTPRPSSSNTVLLDSDTFLKGGTLLFKLKLYLNGKY